MARPMHHSILDYSRNSKGGHLAVILVLIADALTGMFRHKYSLYSLLDHYFGADHEDTSSC